MIQRLLRTAVRFLSSMGLVVGLLVFAGVWSALATVVAQGDEANPAVALWASSHPLIEPAVRAIGLHQAFTSYAFLGCVLILGLSTSVCAWKRTKHALSRASSLRTAARADAPAITGAHDLEIACRPGLTESEVLSIAADVLGRSGLTVKRRSTAVAAVSAPWTVWGSTVFHWALVALMVSVFVGQLLRSEGALALAVSESKPDAPASYLSVEAGSLRNWAGVHRSIRLDSLDPDYKTGGIERGAVPTVSVLDGSGRVLVKQRVYPNNMLHSGSLAINAPGVGLSVWFDLLDSKGEVTGRIIQYVDFSQDASGGTVPVRRLALSNAGGGALRLYATVPLDRYQDGYGEWVPGKPSARLVVADEQGGSLIDRVVDPDESVPLPGGGAIRLLGVGWYSRLSLVDDPTIPLIYLTMIVAILGLTMTVVFRQHLVVASAVKGPEGVRLAVTIRLWRNTPTNRGEIESELAHALGNDDTRRAR